MNLLLLDDQDFVAADRAVLRGRRLAHVREVHRAAVGDELRVGRLGGRMGVGRVLALGDEALELEVVLRDEPPPPLPVILIQALPRPRFFRRMLRDLTTLGVKHIVFLHTRRVEKSFWRSPALTPESLELQVRLGLEQARDTLAPRIEFRRRFRTFVEEDLPALLEDRLALVAHPESPMPCPRGVGRPLTLLVGPEGGLVDEELEVLVRCGLVPVDLGPRRLRVETVLPYLLGRLS